MSGRDPGFPGRIFLAFPKPATAVADILMRITPEDGATGRVLDIHGKVVEYGRLRDDWPDICVRAAESRRGPQGGNPRRHQPPLSNQSVAA